MDGPCSWAAKTLALPTSIYRFNTTQLNMPESCSVDINKLILKFMYKVKTQNYQHMKNKIKGLTIANFKTFCKSVLTDSIVLAKE
jgi:hypothetical protein